MILSKILYHAYIGQFVVMGIFVVIVLLIREWTMALSKQILLQALSTQLLALTS